MSASVMVIGSSSGSCASSHARPTEQNGVRLVQSSVHPAGAARPLRAQGGAQRRRPASATTHRNGPTGRRGRTASRPLRGGESSDQLSMAREVAVEGKRAVCGERPTVV